MLLLVEYRDGVESFNASSFVPGQKYFDVQPQVGGFPVWSLFHLSRNPFEWRYVVGLGYVYVLAFSIRLARSRGHRRCLITVPVSRHDRWQIDAEGLTDLLRRPKTDTLSLFCTLNGPRIASNLFGEAFLGQSKPQSKPTQDFAIHDGHKEIIVSWD